MQNCNRAKRGILPCLENAVHCITGSGAVGAPIDPDPTAHGRPSNARLIRASVCWGQANDTQTSSPPPRRLQRCSQYSSPSPRSVAAEQQWRDVPRKWAAAPARWPCPLLLTSTPLLLHFCPLSHLNLLPSLCWTVFRPTCCLLAAALRGETLPLKPLHCPAPSLPGLHYPAQPS